MFDYKDIQEIVVEALNSQVKVEAAAIDLTDYEEVSCKLEGNKIVFEMPEKYQYVRFGRSAGSGKGSRVPIEQLVKWIRDKGISPSGGQTVNQLAYAIQQSIYVNGIKNAVAPRDFVQEAINKVVKDVVIQFEVDFT
jgi:hypothetical protein